MPGQNTEDSALANMADVSWWAACSAAIAGRSQRWWYDDAVLVQDDPIYSVEMFTEWMVFSECIQHIMSVFRDAFFNC